MADGVAETGRIEQKATEDRPRFRDRQSVFVFLHQNKIPD